MATSWNGGMPAAQVVNSASSAQSSTAMPPIKVARKRWGDDGASAGEVMARPS
jgi:hypothetical protein